MYTIKKTFDSKNSTWDKNEDYNLLFIRTMHNYAYDLLKARGHLFLNEIYDMMGFERTKNGAIAGWIEGSNIDWTIIQNGGLIELTFNASENILDYLQTD